MKNSEGINNNNPLYIYIYIYILRFTEHSFCISILAGSDRQPLLLLDLVTAKTHEKVDRENLPIAPLDRSNRFFFFQLLAFFDILSVLCPMLLAYATPFSATGRYRLGDEFPRNSFVFIANDLLPQTTTVHKMRRCNRSVVIPFLLHPVGTCVSVFVNTCV